MQRRGLLRRHQRWVLGLLAVGGLLAGLERWWWYQRERSQDRHILAAAARYGADPALVKAVVWRESRFNPAARGEAGEVGLMQIGALAAREWAEAERLPALAHEDLFDPAKNTLCGAWYLAKLIRRYAHTDNPPAYALADYNAGRSRVLRWIHGAGQTNSAVFLEQMDFPGTREYVRSILERRRRYAGTLALKTPPAPLPP